MRYLRLLFEVNAGRKGEMGWGGGGVGLSAGVCEDLSVALQVSISIGCVGLGGGGEGNVLKSNVYTHARVCMCACNTCELIRVVKNSPVQA